MTRRCGVLGSPIVHSLSPVLHRAAYDVLGLDWEYDAYDVDEAGLAAFVRGAGPAWRGLSLTRPLKEAAVALCDRLDAPAQLTGAVNTLLLTAEGGRTGHNTDVPGFVAAWRAAGVEQVKGGRPVRSAAVLGAGATARSAVAALGEVGVREITVLLRSPDKAGAVCSLAEHLGMAATVLGLAEDIPPEVDLLVSTLPAGVLDTAEDAGVVERLVTGAAAVCEVVYSPRETALVRSARAHGRPCAEGFDLLLHQAARQVELMTQCETAPVDAMRAAGLAELTRRESGI